MAGKSRPAGFDLKPDDLKYSLWQIFKNANNDIFMKIGKIFSNHLSRARLTGLGLTALLIIFFIVFWVYGQEKNPAGQAQEKNPTLVNVVDIDLEQEEKSEIKAVGAVRPDNAVEVVAQSGGTVVSLDFKVGDEIRQNQILARLNNETALISYQNSLTGENNARLSQLQTAKLADESVRQAEISVQRGLESVRQAEITLANAQNNLSNASDSLDKSVQDQKQAALLAWPDYLNISKNGLDQIDYLLDVDNTNVRLPGLAGNFSALDPAQATRAEASFISARTAYERTSVWPATEENIIIALENAISLMKSVQQAISQAVLALDKTVTDSQFSESAKQGQKASLNSLSALLTQNLNLADRSLSALENIELNRKQQLDPLASAVASAQKQLDLARLAHETSLAGIDAARQSKTQQNQIGQAAIDGASGQSYLLAEQVAKLTIKAPIAGRATAQYVSIGTELSLGQKIGQIAQTDRLKIEINLPATDVYRLTLGQPALMNGDLEGTVAQIAPAADPITKKVRVEIAFDNHNEDLIAGTFVPVSLPIRLLSGEKTGAVFVPLRAVILSQTENFVFLERDGRAVKTLVALGQADGALVEITRGLNHGDRLIVENNKNLADGDPITVAR